MKKLLRVLSVITSIILLIASQPTYVSAYPRGSNDLSPQEFWDGAPSTGTVYYEDVMDRLNDIMSFYLKPGKYWNHVGGYTNGYFTTTDQPCPFERNYHNATYISQDSSLTCHSYQGNEQCAGFALLVCDGIFGTNPRTDDDWVIGSVNSLAVGDYVRLNGHSFVVSWIDPDHQYITVYECNIGGNCRIGTRTASESGFYISSLNEYSWGNQWNLNTNFIMHCTRNTGEHRPSSTQISRTVTFRVLNGSWNDGTTADKVVTLSGSEGSTLSLTASQIPAVGSRPDSAYKAGSWNRTPTAGSAITSNITYTYSYEIKPISYYTVTFKVVNGSWDDGTTADKYEILQVYEGETKSLESSQIPAVGNKPGSAYKAGSWNVTPTAGSAITSNTTYTYTYAAKTPISRTVTFKVVNGSWNDGTTADKVVTLSGYEGDTLSLTSAQIPMVGAAPANMHQAGSWNTTPVAGSAINSNTTYTYTYATNVPVTRTVTFRVENGSWNDGTTEDKTITLNMYEGEVLTLSGADIPAVGNRPNSSYKAGSWNVTPTAGSTITSNTMYTYTYAAKTPISRTVTFKVVNGSWNDGTTADKVVTLSGYEGDTLSLIAAQIPAVGNQPASSYKAGSWNTTPVAGNEISSNVTYTYTYVEDESGNNGGSNNSGGNNGSGNNNESGNSGSESSNSGNNSGTTGGNNTGNNSESNNTGNTGNNTSSSTGNVSTSSNSSVTPVLSYEDRGYLNFNLHFGGAANNYELFRQVQGKLYQEVLKFFMPTGYYELYSVNILENGSVVRDEKQGTMSFIIPEGDRKVGRKYIIFAVDKNGVPHVYYDLDNSDNTITAIIDFEGYAFSVLYTD